VKDIASEASQQLARSLTRRSALAKICRHVLLVSGVATVGLTIADKTPKIARANHECSTTGMWCGLCGKPCTSCGGTYNTCPPGKVGGWYRWIACCGYPDGYSSLVEYWDCCSNEESTCNHAKCWEGCPQSKTWCTGTYYCTNALFVGVTPC
jgi:hypothetical protein